MREVTSAVANKLLKTLSEEKEYLLALERDSSVYVLADGEKTAPPVYNYDEVQAKIDAIDTKVRNIKHAINVFNTTTVLDKIDITIDEALVEMAQLTRKKEKLDMMRKRLPKTRVSNYRNSNVIEYQYVNYDLEKVQKDYSEVCERITEIQVALDLANQTKIFVIED